MAVPEIYEKRAKIPQKDQIEFTYYTDRAKRLLQMINNSELLEFRCSDGIIRTAQGAYLLESAKTAHGEKRRIQNQDFIEFMRSKEPMLPPGKRILLARVCELEDNTIFLFYTIGVYDSKDADTKTPRLVMLNSRDNESFIQIIPGGIFKIKESAAHTRCDKPFQLTRARMLYTLCQEKQDLVSSFYVYQINLKDESSDILETCINKYDNGLKTSCLPRRQAGD